MKKGPSNFFESPVLLVGTARFELTTSRTPSEFWNFSLVVRVTQIASYQQFSLVIENFQFILYQESATILQPSLFRITADCRPLFFNILSSTRKLTTRV